jgi:hypothetical protein
MLVVKASCPHCAAPLALADGQRSVLCGYCDVSLTVQAASTPGAATTTLTKQAIAPAEIDKVKQLVLDGKRAEAIAHYAAIAGLSAKDAETAVNALTWPTIAQMIRQMPLNSFGFLLYAVLFGVPAGLAALGITRGLAGAWWGWLIAAPTVLLALLALRGFVPKARSSWTSSFGSVGRAHVIKRAVIRPSFVRGGSIVVVAFSVTPQGGGAPFVDEEVLLLKDESVAKVDPGNVMNVRYDEPGRRRVFPVSPIEVLGQVPV